MKCNVILLPAKKMFVPTGTLYINAPLYDNGKLHLERCERITVNNHSWSGSGIKTAIQHLYILVDTNNIEINDYVIDNYNTIYKVHSFNNGIFVDEAGNGSLNIKKIVATTDDDLSLPRIEESFIERYVRSYNKKEYLNYIKVDTNIAFTDDEIVYNIKVKDNHICILDNFSLSIIETPDWNSYSIIDNSNDKIVCHLVDNGNDYCKEMGEKILKALNS